MAPEGRSLLSALFCHLVLPLQVPGEQDPNIVELENAITARLTRACKNLNKLGDRQLANIYVPIQRTLGLCSMINKGNLEKHSILDAFSKIEESMVLILHVVKQNAAILVRRVVSNGTDTVIFEAFETSASTESLLAAEGALQWDFPGRAVQIPYDEFEQQSFQQELAAFLEKASTDSLDRFEAQAIKAGVSVSESRDTTDPALITQFLMPFLEAIGFSTKSQTLRKRIRDDVNMYKARNPWRRLPFWLILKVTTQRQLCLNLGNDAGQGHYKLAICMMLSHFLLECSGTLAPELTMMLVAKLGRRLAKLEKQKKRICLACPLFDDLFSAASSQFRTNIQKAKDEVNSAWNHFKQTNLIRKIPHLPTTGQDADFELSLKHSGPYLDYLLNLPKSRTAASKLIEIPLVTTGTIQKFQEFTDRYQELSWLESRIEKDYNLETLSKPGEKGCIELGKAINELFDKAEIAYSSDPEQTSLLILNIFTYWIEMDQIATTLCPLLLEYHPLFSPGLLDALQLPLLSSMRRLQEIQIYLKARCEGCKFQHTIFSEPATQDTFAVRYVEQCPAMQSLKCEIQKASEISRARKEKEWARVGYQYDDLTEKYDSRLCLCTFSYITGERKRTLNGCSKCPCLWDRRKLDIQVHEDLLPADDARASEVLFQLNIPPWFALYRDVTWRILRFAYPSRLDPCKMPEKRLEDYVPLKGYARSLGKSLSLASTKKSFLETHYRSHEVKLDLSKMLLPLALEFSLFDFATKTWVGDMKKPLTFQHLVGIHVPPALRRTVIKRSAHPPPDNKSISSYEIVASQTKCTSEMLMSVYEVMAYQKLSIGVHQRWINLLVELGSTNLNFSSADAMLVITQLAVQAGPASDGEKVLRDSHWIFQNSAFCQRLAEQIELRMRNIANNWREVHCMEMLITLALRMFTLTSGDDQKTAEKLLRLGRKLTLEWILAVRIEVREAGDAMEKVASYGLWAALLCRRTFTMFSIVRYIKLSTDDISSFIRASIALQEHLVVDLLKLPQVLKSMLIRDVKITCQIRSLVEKAMLSNSGTLSSEINAHWLESDSPTQKSYSHWHIHSSAANRWLVSEMHNPTTGTSHMIFYNFVEGHLLVDGKPLERLPLEIRQSPDVQELFGNQHLFTFPSSLPGMSYCMQSKKGGGTIHFGLREGNVVIKAFTEDGMQEFIPRRIFGPLNDIDLPSDLVEECFHWLHLETGVLELRRKPDIWEAKNNDWTINVPGRSARRKAMHLVDPRSDLCQKINTIFSHFEDNRKLIISQSMSGPLSVDLRSLDLSFVVNKKGLLQCQELRSEIDPNQDAGTLYGFESKIVLRKIANPEQRILIFALGELVSERHGMHVSVVACSTRQYGKFGIDTILGRLTCQPEPRLIYSRARLHAFTSFVLPDPLTKRTGTEEAIHALRSASSQPWMPIAVAVLPILKAIQSLSPAREYYPKDKRRMQTMIWRQDLTATIQHDIYDKLVRDIEDTSERLHQFDSKYESPEFVAEASTHLRKRGELRRQRYGRDISDSALREHLIDTAYKPRDRDVRLRQGTFVHHIVKLLRSEDFSTALMKEDLSRSLQKWELIGGFNNKEPVMSSIYDLVESNISEHFGSLIKFCQNASSYISVAFRLGLLSFGGRAGEGNLQKDIIITLAAFSRLEKLKTLRVPAVSSFTRFSLNEEPDFQLITSLIAEDYPPFKPLQGLTRGEHSKAETEYKTQRETEFENFSKFVLEQWPNPKLSNPNSSGILFEAKQLDIISALGKLSFEWQRMLQNMDLSNFIIQVQTVLHDNTGKVQLGVPVPWTSVREVFGSPKSGTIIPSLALDCLANTGPNVLETDEGWLSMHPTGSQSKPFSIESLPPGVVELRAIFKKFADTPNELRKQYAKTLNHSLDSYEKTIEHASVSVTPPCITDIKQSITHMQSQVEEQLACIRRALFTGDPVQLWLDVANLLPCTAPVTILEQLRSISDHKFGEGMKEGLISYGKLITTLQKLLRMQDACLRRDNPRLLAEFCNIGHENWAPYEYPDWLLLEIDGDIMIRSVQVEVAHAIISPASKSNSLLQMNMGQGKTSTILPMVATVLADKKQLTRLVVIKPLLMQTAQSTIIKLGGLIGRVVRHVPFSRRTKTNLDMLDLYSQLHVEILESGGVLLSTPEHVMSYKLSGEQRLIDGRSKEAKQMIDSLSWLTNICRDILDESDFTLAVQRQLIYPSGPREPLDGNPHRWMVAQSLLSLVESYLPSLVQEFPRGIEVVHRANGYPIMHILDPDVEKAIRERIIEDICQGRVDLLRPNRSPAPGLEEQLRNILTAEEFDDRKFSKARWNVQYGLHPSRPPLAVPYENKGVPSEQAEFGFPEVAILLTCLAFYYSGLNQPQFTDSLRIVLKSDDPAAEYDRWIYGSESLPSMFRHWDIINVDDEGQVQELWTHLRVNKSVLNHFLNNCVFPIHAKQFGRKLQASAWDIPLFDQSTKQGEGARTTGFSGTNDNRNLLPLTIQQNDLPSLSQISAEVLTYLLQSRNKSVEIAASKGKRLTERALLKELTKMKIRVLIDAGAYILENDNETLAREWLEIDKQAKGSVFFGEDNRAWVVFKGGKKVQPLLATSFADNLDECLVYLDEAHTRGVDLKLAQTSCGALTLALLQTKDHTVQAAMRLRQLATSQSVVFFAPPEVQRSILDVCHKSASDEIDSSHVIAWLLEQTCRANEHFHNLYLAQGRDFCLRMNAEKHYPNIFTRKDQMDSYVKAILRPERQTLKDLYGNQSKSSTGASSLIHPTLKLKQFGESLDKMQGTRGNKGPQSSALEEVEQEREVEFQVEEVRQNEKPPHFKALEFPGLNSAISRFVYTGNLSGTEGYEQAFEALKNRSIGAKFGICKSDSKLFVSAEYMRTIVFGKDGPNDNFLRPVEWVLWNPETQKALIIIPEEAEELIPIIRGFRQSKVHLISYAAPVTKTKSAFSKLSYYTLPEFPEDYEVPKWLSLDLGIFAGRLYLDFDECGPLIEYLQSAGNLREDEKKTKKSTSPTFFTEKPTDFLIEWLSIRRKGQNIMHTPVGQICYGKVLSKDHHFFKSQTTEGSGYIVRKVPDGGRVDGGASDEDDDTDDEEEEQDQAKFMDE